MIALLAAAVFYVEDLSSVTGTTSESLSAYTVSVLADLADTFPAVRHFDLWTSCIFI